MWLIILIVLSLVIAFVPMERTLKIILSVVLCVLAIVLLLGMAPAMPNLLR